MLEPDVRALLLDNLRPPTGFVLDRAFGTTYSLDLLALMTAPVAFAMFDRQTIDGELVSDPIATLQALRQHASRLTIFCQAGQIAVPVEYRSLLVYLEESIHPVVPLRPDRVFHPKVWYLRYRNPSDGERRFRLLCLSRNLTFDRSWDTVLRLEGYPAPEPAFPELESFATALIDLAAPIRPLTTEQADTVRTLGRDFAHATWDLPAGFDRIRFWPLGHDGMDAWPFPKPRSRVLVIAPFVSSSSLDRLTNGSTGATLVTRPETLDALGGTAVRNLSDRFVLTSSALPVDTESIANENDMALESTSEQAGSALSGLHAKTYIFDYTDGTPSKWICSVWTGSANATDAAFHGNVEFLVQLDGRWGAVGVSSFLSDKSNEGLRKLLEPYTPLSNEPLPPTEQQILEERLARLQGMIGSLRFTVTCREQTTGIWDLSLAGFPVKEIIDLAAHFGVTVTVRPLTLGAGSATSIVLEPNGLMASFTVTQDAVTPYFAVALSAEQVCIDFIIFAELVNSPPDRIERVLLGSLSDRTALMRFLLLLLGSVDDALAAFMVDGKGNGATWTTGLESQALLEPLMRTYARDPDRLRDLTRVLASIAADSDRSHILPEGWGAIWDPIALELEQEASE